jgi:adenylosuccinate synthase
MPVVVVIGGQWGDEGKGRVVDFHSRYCSVIARYSVSNNAGHTIMNDQEVRPHLVPAGIFRGDKAAIIGHGCVIDPEASSMIAMLTERGVSVARLMVSQGAHHHAVAPDHRPRRRGPEAAAIGTTGTGTGPAFHDKVSRIGIRVADLLDREVFAQKLRAALSTRTASSPRSTASRRSSTTRSYREYLSTASASARSSPTRWRM